MAYSRESITFTFTWGPSSLLLTVYLVLSRGQSGQGVKLATHLHVVPRLRMTGPIHLRPLYAFVAGTGVTLFLPFVCDLSLFALLISFRVFRVQQIYRV